VEQGSSQHGKITSNGKSMAQYQIDEHNGLFYIHHPPVRAYGVTFVFFNALTGDTQVWEAEIGPQLRAEGHGTLSFNFRGQKDSPFSPDNALDSALIVDDCRKLLLTIAPESMVLCGLSIGGLFAVQSWLVGLETLKTAGLVLINTLRRDSQRLHWINDALVRCTEVGGLQLFRDLFVPLLFNEEWQAINRQNFLQQAEYTPLKADDGHYNLLKNAGSADWNLPYEDLTLPVLVLTGLQDHVFLELEEVRKISSRLPDARHITLANAGHMLPAERPVELIDSLLKFVEEVQA
jgi:pimeloyl-ACP methyl ester carboxylesterase